MSSSPLNFLYEFLKKNKSMYLIGMFAVLVTNIAQVTSTRIIGWVIDLFTDATLPHIIIQADKKTTFLYLFGAMVGVRLIVTIGRFGWRITLGRQTHKAGGELRSKIWDNVRFFYNKDLNTRFTKGELMNVSNSDVNAARFIFGFTLVGIFDVAFLGLITLFAMLTIHVKLSLVTLSTLLILPFIVRKLSDLEITRYRVAQETLSDFNDLSTQVISSIRLQRVTQTGDFWRERLTQSADEYRQKRISAVFTSLRYFPVMGSASTVAYIVLFFFGIGHVFNGEISPGDFVALQGLVLLIQDPFLELGYIISDWKKAVTSLHRLNDIYDNEKDESLFQEGEELVASKQILSVKNLGFKYDNKSDFQLREISFELEQGDRVGIMGPIGCGKSTLLQIISGLERGASGSIEFLGYNFNHYSHENLRDYIINVPQKPFLFADTIFENVSLGKTLTEDEVWKYLNLAGLKTDVENFPDGLDTPLGEWGINLSGGQKQRLTIARALAAQPKLLLLDDCLSAVDTVTEEKILRNLDTHLKDTTIIWVAHRKSTLKYCDKLIELNNGTN